MDQKRTLWIVGAVGLFLIVVVGFALIIYAPERKASKKDGMTKNELLSSNDIWSSTQDSDFIPVYPAKSTEDKTSQGVLPSDSMNLVGNSDSVASEESGLATQTANESQIARENSAQNVQNLTVISENTQVVTNGKTIDLTGIMNTVNQPTVVQSPTSTSSPSNLASTNRATSVNSTSTTPVAPKSSAKPASSASSTKPAPKPQPATQTASVPRYWIQVSSYSSKKNAEEARNCLKNEKIPSEIFTFTDANGNLFYRVRVGPYSTKSEAEYNQTRIKSISKFASTNTYITDSSKKLASAK